MTRMLFTVAFSFAIGGCDPPPASVPSAPPATTLATPEATGAPSSTPGAPPAASLSATAPPLASASAASTATYPRPVPLREWRYVTKDMRCFRVKGTVHWRPTKAFARPPSSRDDRGVRFAADSFLVNWVGRRTHAAAHRVPPQQLGSTLAHELNSRLSEVGIAVLGATIDAVIPCRFEPRTFSVPKERYLTADKHCLTVALTVVWDPATRPLGFNDSDMPRVDDRIRDQVRSDVRMAVAREWSAELLKRSKKQWGAPLMASFKKGPDGNTIRLHAIRVDEVARCP